MRLRLAFFAVALSLLAPLGSEAAACAVGGFLGEPELTPEQRLAEERRQARTEFESRAALARANWAAGVDGAAALAEMLVPNVRPVRIFRVCFYSSEIDWARDSQSHEILLEGTAFEGRARALGDLLNQFEGELPGRPCNAEFRSRFAGHLRGRLTRRQLRAAYLFLGARWTALDPNSPRTRIMQFLGGQRRPPLVIAVADERQRGEIVAWMRGNPAGRAVQRAVGDFWRENAPGLDSMAATCPVEAVRWEAERARFLELMTAEEVRQRALNGEEKR